MTEKTKKFQSFERKSRKKLDDDEKTNLEKAMRVIALDAMRLKWEQPEKYERKSFNDISLKMIDGLSYSSVVDLAEDILKEKQKRNR
ncbi:hypothetical protein [Solitalea lacus]|uniref:hypothetical protein n=1 Tax=Solitalea lacus TaxID=2911172 RepID=UPI001EDC4F40|nr:hypothetical protein [Solitalea lacus]UKJ08528.1 hypothetical protein L2B55_05035 [Solitalea lacus]